MTGASSASSTTNVTSCTVTTDAGIVSRGKRALRISAPWSSSDGAALSSDWLKKIHTTSPMSRNSGYCSGCAGPATLKTTPNMK